MFVGGVDIPSSGAVETGAVGERAGDSGGGLPRLRWRERGRAGYRAGACLSGRDATAAARLAGGSCQPACYACAENGMQTALWQPKPKIAAREPLS